MKNRVIYDSPEQAMNESRIKIFVSSGYERVIPQYFKDNNIQPIYDVDNEDCVSFVPIVELVYMFAEKVEFRVADIEDIDYIRTIVKNYLEYIKDPEFFKVQNMTIDQKNIIERCEKFLNEMDYQINRVQKTEGYKDKQILPKGTVVDIAAELWR